MVTFRALAEKAADGLSAEAIDPFFQWQERRGLRLAAIGQLIAVLAIIGQTLFTVSGVTALWPLGLSIGFGVFAVLRIFACSPSWYRSWTAYVFVTVEMALLTLAVTVPNPLLDAPWPRQLAFRQDNFVYFFIPLAMAAFSHRPRLVLWSGLAAALCWGTASTIVLGFEDTLRWPTSRQIGAVEALEIFLQPTFMSVDGRWREGLVILIVAGLLAGAVWRSRSVVRREIRMRHERGLLREAFGRFVPEGVDGAMLDRGRALAPESRIATILFCDIAGFTAIVEREGPSVALAMLDAWFESACRVLTQLNGTIYQFQGDAIVAAFNIPVSDPDHAAHALTAARDLLILADEATFAGQRLSVRIGVATGPVIAGLVGGQATRLDYTVHGDAANLAARLEQLNKDKATAVLVDQATVDKAAPEPGLLYPVDHVSVRGLSRPVTIHSLFGPPYPPQHPAAGGGITAKDSDSP